MPVQSQVALPEGRQMTELPRFDQTVSIRRKASTGLGLGLRLTSTTRRIADR